MRAVWDFIQYQLLGMRWLDDLFGRLLAALGLDVSGRLGGSLQFFLFDVVKIFLLLSILIFAISYLQSHFPPERTKKILGRFKGIWANAASAFLGTLTPFCSCSSIPIFIGFTNAGLPAGVTFSFLISSPLVDLGALILLMSVFGPAFALSYVLVGLALAVLGGTLIDALGMEKYVIRIATKASAEFSSPELRMRDRLIYAKDRLLETVGKVWPYVLAGVGIGALIHNWIPEAWVQAVLGGKNPFSVLIATAVGVPMYADIFGAIPVAEALHGKGVGVGTVLSFMMSVTALSLPSIIMLKRVVKTRLLAIFVGIVTAGIVMIGYLFNALGFLFA
jgi:uncharacterized protein